MPTAFEKVIVCYDGREHSRAALSLACALAGPTSADLLAADVYLNAVEWRHPPSAPRTLVLERYDDLLKAEAEAVLSEAASASSPGVPGSRPPPQRRHFARGHGSQPA